MMELIYKIVRCRDGKRVSLTDLGGAPWSVEYPVNDWAVSPSKLAEKGYYLTAFKDRESAEKFFRKRLISDYRQGDVELWAAEGELVEKLRLYKSWTNLRRILNPPPDDYWCLSSTSMPQTWPEGTVMCRRLRLLTRLSILSEEQPEEVDNRG